MRSPLIATLALLVALFQEPPVKLVKEAWPNGSPKVEREVAVDEKGIEINHGAYRSWHENGKPESEGRYSKGLLSGEWQSWYANGERASRGRYLKDRRDGKWFFWHDNGAENTAWTGKWKFETWTDDSGASAEGYTVDERRQDLWTFRWPDGTVLLEGRYRNGMRHGEWLLRHEDGGVARFLVSGTYEGPQRTAALSDERWSELAVQPRSAPTRKAKPLRAPSASAPATELLELDAAECALAQLLALDVATQDGAKRAKALDEALRRLSLGHGFGWREGDKHEDAEYRREVVRSWKTLWRLALSGTQPWCMHVTDDAPKASDASAVLGAADVPITREGPLPGEPSESWLAARRSGQKELKTRGGAHTDEALWSALDWLVRHQSQDGRWSCAQFALNCGKLSKTQCDGAGEDVLDGAGMHHPLHDVGVTGLALLALLGEGNTLTEGPYHESVAKAARWLIGLQGSKGEHVGIFGRPMSVGYHYSHAMATQALCELSAFSRSAAVSRRAQRAIEYILLAQNPYSAWRYEYPPTGENDTSITAWMLCALAAAEQAGLLVEPTAVENGLRWIDEVTDPTTGRCGYNELGGLGARTAEAYNAFPAERNEALTGAALWCRILAGQRRETQPLLERHAALLIDKPPKWHLESGSTDLYAWYWGSLAMYQMGGAQWEAWNAGLKTALLDNQRVDGDAAGSWDPLDPWGAVGGRVYITAMAALCLETYFRYPAMLPQVQKKKR